MAAGDAFTQEQLDRLNRARSGATRQTGIPFHVRVGPVSGDPKAAADRLLAELVDHPSAEGGLLVLVSPGQRFVRIATTAATRRRISDSAAALAALSMTSSFAVGDLVGGLVAGLRQLADAAGSASPTDPADPATTGSAES